MAKTSKPAPAPKPELPPLPAGITAADLKYPDWRKNERTVDTFELWATASFGWCIPTLLIRHGRATSDRTYATRVSDGAPVRIGMGPHVVGRVTVYVREARKEALQRYLDLKAGGEQDANNIRDRISSRRAQGALYRMRRGW